nr:hypothetical protein [Tanacetum cinerariifolium]
MEMVAVESIEVGEDLTPGLCPMAYSLHDSFLVTHCATCFNPLPFPIDNNNNYNDDNDVYRYCSARCSSSHSPIHFSSHHLSSSCYSGETSDLRVALVLLLQIKRQHAFPSSSSCYDRIIGLMTNRHKLIFPSSSAINDNDEFATKIKIGAKAIAAAASSTRTNSPVLGSHNSVDDLSLTEALLCLVLTNAVEVQDSFGRLVGIALYDTSFSWINHSCSPNACYRFLPPATPDTQRQCLITPVSSNGHEPVTYSDFCLIGLPGGGPRIVVRSIKPINKGEQVTISYTDLLQPKDVRQVELWSKYRFNCQCLRCVKVPLSYVDQLLKEVWGSGGSLLHNAVLESFTNCIDVAIDDYLSSNDAESCCMKLENALLNGLCYKQHIIRLHPQNHLSLNVYTTLASAYKFRANLIQYEHAATLNFNRSFSVAYSFLLAILTHNMYLSESSLIVSVSNFWIGAGESLLNLATMLESDSSSDLTNSKCSKCHLIDTFEAYRYDHNMVLEISKEFLNCITDIIPKVWKFLVQGNDYLGVIKDPMNLRWFEILNAVGNNKCNEAGIVEGYAGQERVELFGLGVHCLLYGGILSKIFGGHDSPLSCNVRSVLYHGKVKL